MTFRLLPVAAIVVAAALSGDAAAQEPWPITVADADCSQAAADVAAETGGRVLMVRSRRQDGRMVCVVTVLVPADGGGRPRRQTVAVPQ